MSIFEKRKKQNLNIEKFFLPLKSLKYCIKIFICFNIRIYSMTLRAYKSCHHQQQQASKKMLLYCINVYSIAAVDQLFSHEIK